VPSTNLWLSVGAVGSLHSLARQDETEGTYGHLERERHERRVDLDAVLGGVQARPPASTLLDAGGATEGQRRDFPREDSMVEGKGFEPSTSALRTPRSPN
jgi:hypothetical protein